MSKIQKFYKTAKADVLENGFGVFLDNRKLVTPAKMPLIVANIEIAQLVADEWGAQIDEIKTASMPITRLINVAIDRTPETRELLCDEVRKYASSDLLCYQVIAPQILAQTQAQIWNPILDWAKTDLGLEMIVVKDSLALVQAPQSLEKVREIAIGFDDLRLTILAHVVALTGSAILALAFLNGRIAAKDCFDAIRIEEEHNAKIWGHDYEDLDKAKEKLCELEAVEKLIKAL